MKKLLLLLLIAATLMLSLTSCGDGDTLKRLNGKTPETVYDKALLEFKESKNYTLNGTQTVTVLSSEGEEITEQSFTAMFDGHNMHMSYSVTNIEDSELEIWYIDNTYYLKVAELLKLKAVIPFSLYSKTYIPNGSSLEDNFPSFSEEWFTDASFTKDDNGEYYIEFAMDGNEFAKYFNEISLPETEDSSIIYVDEIIYRAYFNTEGALTKATTSLMFISGGITVTAISEVKLSLLDNTVITPPDKNDAWVDKTDNVEYLLTLIGN